MTDLKRASATANGLARYFPIFDWGRSYDVGTATNDLVAALIVTIMLIPQSLAYAMLAGLPPEVGLYTYRSPPMLSLARAGHWLSARSLWSR